MKKLIALFLLLIISSSFLLACVKDNESEGEDNPSVGDTEGGSGTEGGGGTEGEGGTEDDENKESTTLPGNDKIDHIHGWTDK